MTAKPLSRRAKVATAVPVALVSGLWTANLFVAGATSAQAANGKSQDPLPDGTSVPSQAIEAPASIPVSGALAPAVPQGQADKVIASAANSGIPAPALAAYQRAAQVISQADQRCNIPWSLIAAIGRVESDHGRYGGNTLTDAGVSQPGVFGPVLDGASGTQEIKDTDGGQLDKDSVYDRAVGPMQFIPSTWETVKVDGDNDGTRDPQNINDAALAAAVYLCSGEENLSERAGQEKAVYRYNHSNDYVNLVLRIMEAYASGNFSAMPSGSYAGTSYTPNYSSAYPSTRFYAHQKARARAAKRAGTTSGPGSMGTPGGGSGNGNGNGDGAGPAPSNAPAPAPEGGPATPANPPAATPTNTPSPSQPATPSPSAQPTMPVNPNPTTPPKNWNFADWQADFNACQALFPTATWDPKWWQCMNDKGYLPHP